MLTGEKKKRVNILLFVLPVSLFVNGISLFCDSSKALINGLGSSDIWTCLIDGPSSRGLFSFTRYFLRSANEGKQLIYYKQIIK